MCGFPAGSVVKNLPANAGDSSLIPGSGGSPGEGNGSSLQYSCLENPMDRGALRASIHRVAKCWTQLKQLSTSLDSLNYALLWSQIIHPKCKFTDITSLLKSFPIAFSRMPKNGVQGLSWAISYPCLKTILHIFIALYASASLKYSWFLYRFMLLLCVCA